MIKYQVIAKIKKIAILLSEKICIFATLYALCHEVNAYM